MTSGLITPYSLAWVWLAVGFILIWLLSKTIVHSTEKISRLLRLPQFLVASVILGIATSLPEIAVVISSLLLKTPDLAVGNLLGGQIYLLFLIIPLFIFFANGVRLQPEMQSRPLMLAILTLSAPLIVIIDGRISWSEAVTLIISYLLFLTSELRLQRNTPAGSKSVSATKKAGKIATDLAVLIAAAATMFVVSRLTISSLVIISNHWHIPEFLAGFLLLTFGTNLPETSLAISAIILKKKQIALGDYIGSASFNTLLLGILGIISGSGGMSSDFQHWSFSILVLLGIGIFWWVSRSQRKITKLEAAILLCWLGLIVGWELFSVF